MKHLLILLFTLVLMTSCNSNANDKSLLQSHWQLEKINGEKLNDSMARPTLKIDLAEMLLSGNAGCNVYTGSIFEIGAKDHIGIDNIATTLKICPEANYENIYMDLMNQVKKYEVNETNLYFKNEDDKVILEYKKGIGTKNTVRIHDIWSAVRIEGNPINRMVTIPSIEFNTQDMKIYGNDGCNEYFGTLTNLTDKSISFGKIGTTRKICDNMEFSERYQAAITKTHSYKFDNRFLILLDEDGNEVLAFLKTD